MSWLHVVVSCAAEVALCHPPRVAVRTTPAPGPGVLCYDFKVCPPRVHYSQDVQRLGDVWLPEPCLDLALYAEPATTAPPPDKPCGRGLVR